MRSRDAARGMFPPRLSAERARRLRPMLGRGWRFTVAVSAQGYGLALAALDGSVVTLLPHSWYRGERLGEALAEAQRLNRPPIKLFDEA